MTSQTEREQHIPFRKAEILELCATDPRLAEGDAAAFRAFGRILESVFHFEYHAVLERLKDAYAPFDPDASVRSVKEWTPEERQQAQEQLTTDLRNLVEAANFEEVSEEALQRALSEDTLLKLRLQVDFDDFDEVVFFRRGKHTSTETLRQLFGLRKQAISFVNYDRVLVFVKFKDAEHFDEKRRRELPFEPGSTIIKLFQDVPQGDLEMLFPNTQVRMRTIDKLVIGVPAVAGGIAVISTKLLASLGLIIVLIGFWLGLRDEPVVLDQASVIALGGSLGAVGGYLARQFNKFKTRKIRFMKTLSDNLYFKNLDNDVGVFHHLLDAAEEEECKEAVLAYFFLLTSEDPLDATALDHLVEVWFEERLGCHLDFEIHDALGKLERLGLAERVEGARYRARPLPDAKAELDRRWDGYFDYEPRPVGALRREAGA